MFLKPKKVNKICYKTFVRPHIEYSATVLDPHTASDINKVEVVQRRAARLVTCPIGILRGCRSNFYKMMYFVPKDCFLS